MLRYFPLLFKYQLCINDYKRAEHESHDIIATLKEEKSSLLEQVNRLTARLDKMARQNQSHPQRERRHVRDDEMDFLKQQVER